MKALLIPIGLAIGVQLSIAATRVEALMAYGTGEPITEGQAVSVLYLAYPQSYGAMVDLLGYPDARDSRSDWYRLTRGRWLVIHYDGPRAIGYQWRDF